jgi:anti-anti-sigma regulatory factor
MLKITRQTSESNRVALRLEGQVIGPWVEALRQACEEVRSGNGRKGMVLDLSGVSFIDARGVALFRELVSHHAELKNGSVYIAEQLKEVVHGSD